MIKIDEDFVAEVGLSEMPPAEKEVFMAEAKEELEMRVGEHLGRDLSDEQLEEFVQIQDPRLAAEWLEKHTPGYREAVKQIFRNFKEELFAERAEILGMAA